MQLIGVYDGAVCEKLAHVLRNLGSHRALLVHGVDGLDELSTLGETAISELKDGQVTSYTLDAEWDLGLARATIEHLAGCESPAENADVLLHILQGKDRGPKRDIVLLNAAGVLLVADVEETLEAGMERAAALIDSGAALATLERLQGVHECLSRPSWTQFWPISEKRSRRVKAQVTAAGNARHVCNRHCRLHEILWRRLASRQRQDRSP